jgi:hypothetical protein
MENAPMTALATQAETTDYIRNRNILAAAACYTQDAWFAHISGLFGKSVDHYMCRYRKHKSFEPLMFPVLLLWSVWRNQKLDLV